MGCHMCGGPKPKTRGRQFCDACRVLRRREAASRHRASPKGRESTRRYVDANRDKYRAYSKKCYLKHRPRLTEESRSGNRERALRRRLERYGLTEHEYESMLGGGCNMCGREQDGRVSSHGTAFRLALDHDHSTGRLRGVLCGTCNTRLGWYENNRDKLEEYLCR